MVNMINQVKASHTRVAFFSKQSLKKSIKIGLEDNLTPKQVSPLIVLKSSCKCK
jgi:hypothetical protein